MSGIDLRSEWLAQLDRITVASGRKSEAAILGFVPWVESLAQQGLKIDGIDFELSSRPVLKQIYMSMPATIEEARRSTIVLMKSAQMGASC